MASRIPVSKAKSYLSSLDGHIMETPSLYFVPAYSDWIAGMRNKGGQASLGSNPSTQLLQTAFIDSSTGQVQALPDGHAWQTKGASVRYKAIFVEYANADLSPQVALRMGLDVLFSRACPPAICFIANRALSFLPKTFLAAQAKKRLGPIAGPAFVEMIAGIRKFLDATLEQRGPKRKASQARKISWGAMNTKRAKRTPSSKTPSKPKEEAPVSKYQTQADTSEFVNVEVS